MPHYVKRPEPGRFFKKETVVERIVEKPKETEKEALDINALANAIAKVINVSIPQGTGNAGQTVTKEIDSFDNSKTMERLATQMLVERGENSTNFEELGNVKETKRDQKDVDDTIDLLSKLDN